MLSKLLNRNLPFEASTVVAAGGTTTVIVKGEVVPGARAIRHLWLSYADTITDLQVKIIPKSHPNVMGGDVFHTIRAVATPVSSNRHQIALGFDLPQGEDVTITLASVTGGTFSWRLDRLAIRDTSEPIDIPE